MCVCVLGDTLHSRSFVARCKCMNVYTDTSAGRSPLAPAALASVTNRRRPSSWIDLCPPCLRTGDARLNPASPQNLLCCSGNLLSSGPVKLLRFPSVCCYLSGVMTWRQEKLSTFLPEQWSCLIRPLGNQPLWLFFFFLETGRINAAIFRHLLLVH